MSSSTDITVIERLDSLTTALTGLARILGARLTRAEVCQRLGIHRNTLSKYMAEKGFPKPGRDGKWLVAEVVEWEAQK